MTKGTASPPLHESEYIVESNRAYEVETHRSKYHENTIPET